MEAVALLAEGVDRNKIFCIAFNANKLSPSSRRAWIEICWQAASPCCWVVALLAEGVDRNLDVPG